MCVRVCVCVSIDSMYLACWVYPNLFTCVCENILLYSTVYGKGNFFVGYPVIS